VCVCVCVCVCVSLVGPRPAGVGWGGVGYARAQGVYTRLGEMDPPPPPSLRPPPHLSPLPSPRGTAARLSRAHRHGGGITRAGLWTMATASVFLSHPPCSKPCSMLSHSLVLTWYMYAYLVVTKRASRARVDVLK
jgi:hypothetical protein